MVERGEARFALLFLQRRSVGTSFANLRARNPGKCIDLSLPSTNVVISSAVMSG